MTDGAQSNLGLAQEVDALLARLGVGRPDDGDLVVHTPITGEAVASVRPTSVVEATDAIGRADEAFRAWREVPAPQRGELVRRLGGLLRRHKDDLGALVTIEVGKIRSEGRGEVQEMIDVCDFAVGLGRQLYGRTMASERPGHRLMETWHPLGVCGVITAFNFPVAVWAWNAALAIVCGDPVVWKPSDKTPLTAIACAALFEQAVDETRRDAGIDVPDGLLSVVQGGRDVGEALVDDRRVPIVSATGSVAMGKAVGPRVAARLGRSLLELGGNNGMIVAPSADLDLATRAIVFSAAGTAGQRCTTLRRLIVHDDVHDDVVGRVTRAYSSLVVGNPLDDGVLVGPLIDGRSHRAMVDALDRAVAAGSDVICGGGRVLDEVWPDAFYVEPALVSAPGPIDLLQEETFAPVLWVQRYEDFDEALAVHNDVPQGLSSAVFTNDVRESERFLSAAGSDCGIANVNVGPSGAEIGGAFGGEKETGGGRESGSDSWKAYMRRATNTINATSDLPLAQGVEFT